MNKLRLYRAVLLLGTVCLLITGGGGLWLRSVRRQDALNRQLIAALVKQDAKQALVLVNAGADPNTPFDPPSPPTLTQLWNHLVHRTVLPRSVGAFHMACGSFVSSDVDHVLPGMSTDEPHLVETMLQHGAQKNAKDGLGWTPLFWSCMLGYPKTVDVLLKYGVDVNAQDSNGYTVLTWAIFVSPVNDPSQESKNANLVRKLLAHRADPNLRNQLGQTPLQLAHDSGRGDLEALLKQAGAKK